MNLLTVSPSVLLAPVPFGDAVLNGLGQVATTVLDLICWYPRWAGGDHWLSDQEPVIRFVGVLFGITLSWLLIFLVLYLLLRALALQIALRTSTLTRPMGLSLSSCVCKESESRV